eukprot:1154429-Pelagomonas_calceolata.AAC.1
MVQEGSDGRASPVFSQHRCWTGLRVISDTLNLVTPYDWLASTHLESMPKDLLNANWLSRCVDMCGRSLDMCGT